MATLNTKSFAQIVRDQATAIQAKASGLINFSIGAVLRSVAEANAGVVLWLQGMILQVLTVTRAATSIGPDLDSFVNDYSLKRLGATASSGNVTFSRFTPTSSAFIPVGSRVQTADFTQTFTVSVDTTNTAYSATLNGYTIPAAVSSLTVPVAAQTASAASNVAANSVSVILDSMIGVDTVNNAIGFSGGSDGETDAALRARFVAYINSLSKGTEAAITFAIQSVQTGMQVQIFENQQPGGATDYGNVTVYVDDGSGAIPSTTLAAASAAAQAVRAAGVRMSILGATRLTANITMTIVTAPAYNHNTLIAQVVAAVNAYVNAAGLGNTVSYIGVGGIAMSIAGVVDVTNYTLNGVAADLVPAAGQTVKVGTIVVS